MKFLNKSYKIPENFIADYLKYLSKVINNKHLNELEKITIFLNIKIKKIYLFMEMVAQLLLRIIFCVILIKE